jgi:1-deoxy-D-xylulose-5-phosphate synthase
LLSIGKAGIFAKRAVKSLENKDVSAAHYDLRFVKPIDKEMLAEVFENFKYIVTIEDGAIQGGFGSAVLEFMAQNNYSATIKLLGIPDKFIEHGTLDDLYRECGIDVKGITSTVLELLGKTEIDLQKSLHTHL